MSDLEASARTAKQECGVTWQKGKPQEILGTSCSGVVYPVGMGFYTVVQLYGKYLYFGQATETADGSSDGKRLMKLYPIPLAKLPGNRR